MNARGRKLVIDTVVATFLLSGVAYVTSYLMVCERLMFSPDTRFFPRPWQRGYYPLAYGETRLRPKLMVFFGDPRADPHCFVVAFDPGAD